MKTIKLIGASALLLSCSVLTSEAALSLAFASTTVPGGGIGGATINFNGDSTFSFAANSAGSDFTIGVATDGTGDALGDTGIINGLYTIQTVTSTPLGGGLTLETAPVTGSGTQTLTISDGHGGTFIGNVSWIGLTTLGTIGNLNLTGTVNLTGVSYTGSSSPQADLTTLADNAQDIASLSFTLVPPQDIVSLKSTVSSTTFAGSIAVPEPTTMIAGAMLLLPFGASTLRTLRKRVA